MKISLYAGILLAAAFSFTACTKSEQDQVTPLLTEEISGTWQLTSRFNTDSAKWVPVVAGDSSVYVFRNNGTYVFHTNNYHNEGSYHLSLVDSSIKLVTPEEPNGLLIQRLNENEIRVDAWLFSRMTGHSGRKFKKVAE